MQQNSDVCGGVKLSFYGALSLYYSVKLLIMQDWCVFMFLLSLISFGPPSSVCAEAWQCHMLVSHTEYCCSSLTLLIKTNIFIYLFIYILIKLLDKEYIL